MEACRAHNPEVNGSKPLPANAITNGEKYKLDAQKIIFFRFLSKTLSSNNNYVNLITCSRGRSWLVRRTYKQCWSICEGRGFDPLREQVLKFLNRYCLNKHWIFAVAKIYYILPFKIPQLLKKH